MSSKIKGSNFYKNKHPEAPLDLVFGHFWGHCLTKVAFCGPKNQFLEGSGSVLKITLKKGVAGKRDEARWSDLGVPI